MQTYYILIASNFVIETQ